MDESIKVSISCLVYNHEKYLRQCLDGFVMQKTNFKFEVLVHDDASTDHSADIIREYEEKYPEIIKPIYQKENQYSKHVPISRTFQYPRAKGKYIAWCEGDDYWCDENKLQLQYDAMEKDKSVSFCVHRIRFVSEDGLIVNKIKPEFNCPQYMSGLQLISSVFENNLCPFQLSSFMIKTSILKVEPPIFFTRSPVGDLPIMLLAGLNGNTVYIDKIMSCYRCNSLGSWSTRIAKNNEAKIAYLHKMHSIISEFDIYTNKEFHELISVFLLKWEFDTFLIEKEYKKILQKKYSRLFDELTVKEKIYYTIFGHFPKLHKLYNQMKH